MSRGARRRHAGGARKPRRRHVAGGGGGPRAICRGARRSPKIRTIRRPRPSYDELRLRAIARQRQTLDRLRADGTIGDEAYHRLEEEIDWAELDAAPAGRFQPLTT